MTMPNFFLIGAPKAGTTSVYEYLLEHPQIYMCPVKEPNFFEREGQPLSRFAPYKQHQLASMGLSLDGDYTIDFYRQMFAGAADEPVVGEASVGYIYHSEEVIAGVKRYCPDAKLLLILRNPVERSYSQYLHALMYQGETVRDFATALAHSPHREQYLHTYADHLERYREAFGEQQLLVCLYDDLRRDPIEFMQRIYRYLGVDDRFEANLASSYNVTYYPKTNWLGNLLASTKGVKRGLARILPAKAQVWLYHKVLLGLDSRFNRGEAPVLSEDMRRELEEYFREDIGRVQRLIGRDLTGWLRQGTARVTSPTRSDRVQGA